MTKRFFVAIFCLIVFPIFTEAQVVVTEIMYDLEGADSGREWIEILNSAENSIPLSEWRLFEGNTNHKINVYSGGEVVSSGGYAVIADNPEKFLVDQPDFSGPLFGSSFSLNNTGETLIIRNPDLVDIDSVSYSSELGAAGDGNSLQKIDGKWVASTPTPGESNYVEDASLTQQKSQQEGQSESQPVSEPAYAQTSAQKAEFTAKILGEDRVAIVGSQVNFEGVVLDSSGKPVKMADFLWSFGDGSSVRGRLANHIYNYPGKYIVFLNVGVSGASFGDSITVDVIPNEVLISEIKPGAGGWTEIINGSEHKIDLSHWAVSNEREAFYFPKNTFIGPKTYLVVTKEISGIEFSSSGSAFLLYPRGEVAHELTYFGVLKSDESFHNVEGVARVGVESPASGRFVARVSLGPSKPIVPDSASIESAQEVVKDSIDIQRPENNAENNTQTAAVSTAQFFGSTMFWFLIALAVGILSAVGYLFMVRHRSL